MKRTMQMMIMGALVFAVSAQAAVESPTPKPLAEKVRHELMMLPYYNIFDNLAYRVEGDTVYLSGQVVRPTLREDAGRAVRTIPGVAKVENQIEVLPLSGFDSRIRLATARAIYGYTALSRYSLGAHPPIRIIVRNGHVTLEGVVANETDRNLAFLRANGVFGAFSVTNHLRVEKSA